MIRRQIKILGIGLVAAMVLGVAGVSTAMAEEDQGVLTSEEGNAVTLTATEIGESANVLTAFGTQTECPGSTGTGHKAETTPHELIPNGSTSITMTAHSVNCTAETPFGNRPATVKTNGCDSVLQIGKTVSENTYEGSTEIICPEGQVGEAIVYETANHENSICVLKLAPQTITGSAEVTNASGDLKVTGTATGIHITRSGLCTLDGKGTTTNNGEAHGEGTIEAHDEELEPEGITISEIRS